MENQLYCLSNFLLNIIVKSSLLLKSINLSINHGEKVLILGPSGSEKAH